MDGTEKCIATFLIMVVLVCSGYLIYEYDSISDMEDGLNAWVAVCESRDGIAVQTHRGMMCMDEDLFMTTEELN